MNILTKRSSVSLFLGGLMMAVGLYFAPAIQAEELPDANLHNQLDTEINQQATNEVNQALQQHPVTAPQATEASNNGANQTQQANQPNQSPLIINTGGNA